MRDRLAWFERRPLFGQTIAVTRTRQQASELSAALSDLGADVIEAPTIELRQPADMAAIDGAIGKAAEFDWIIFTSQNGVSAVKDRLLAMGRDVRAFGGARCRDWASHGGRGSRGAVSSGRSVPGAIRRRGAGGRVCRRRGEIAGKRFCCCGRTSPGRRSTRSPNRRRGRRCAGHRGLRNTSRRIAAGGIAGGAGTAPADLDHIHQQQHREKRRHFAGQRLSGKTRGSRNRQHRSDHEPDIARSRIAPQRSKRDQFSIPGLVRAARNAAKRDWRSKPRMYMRGSGVRRGDKGQTDITSFFLCSSISSTLPS